MHATPRTNALASHLAGMLVLVLAVPVQAQIAAPTVVPEAPFPGDRIGVPLLSGGACEQGTPDPARPPRIRVASEPDGPPQGDRYTYQLDYWLIDPGVVCAAPAPRIFERVVDIGPLPEGLHEVYVTLHVDGATELTYVAQPFEVARRDAPNRDISGIWWAAEQGGRGFSVVRTAQAYALYWATHDAAGQPEWITLVTPEASDATLAGTAINTHGSPLAPGAAQLAAQAWGAVRFEYLGCGRATFTWDALDAQVGDGALALTQVGLPLGVPPCDVAELSHGLAATWVED